MHQFAEPEQAFRSVGQKIQDRIRRKVYMWRTYSELVIYEYLLLRRVEFGGRKIIQKQ